VTELWTIGHSRAEVARIIDLLAAAGVSQVSDVRSQPYSKIAPQFDRPALDSSLRRAGIHYEFMGDELGGRPREPSAYDAEGYVLYGRVAQLPQFQEGLQTLKHLAAQHRTAVLCSEEDPQGCHRHLLIARVLDADGIAIKHLRHDETVQPYGSMADVRRATNLPRLFDEQDSTWRSTRSVSRNEPPRTSSAL
jgi:uncharacterized protein (DUF488 family)